MTTYSILASSNWRDYQFNVPIASLLWLKRINLLPVVYRVGDWSRPRGVIAQRFLYDLNATVVDVSGAIDLDEPHVAQNIRQHAAADQFYSDGDYLITSDADLWVFDRAWIHDHLGKSPIVSWYANGDHYQSLPTCHIGARVKTWREFMKLGSYDSSVDALRDTIETWHKPRTQGKAPSDAGWINWMSDQWRTTELIKASRFWKGEVALVERKGHPPVDRIDRSNWPKAPTAKGFVDAHVPKATETDEVWPTVAPLLEELLSGEDFRTVCSYREKYARAEA